MVLRPSGGRNPDKGLRVLARLIAHLHLDRQRRSVDYLGSPDECREGPADQSASEKDGDQNTAPP